MIADSFRIFLFDLDGVIWRGKELLPGAKEVVEELRKRGKTLRFLTNNPRRTREEVQKQLGSLGIRVALGEIVTASWATAWYLKERGFTRSYVLGSKGLQQELEAMGITVGGDSPQAVVVGYDEAISFGEITQAIRLVDGGAELVATNPEVAFTPPEGKMPATGSVVEVLERLTGRKAIIVGKPSPYIFELLFQELGEVRREEVALVGDSIETDIQGAHGVGIFGILYATRDVLLPFSQDPRCPDAVIVHLEELLGRELPPPRKKAVGVVIQDGEGRILLIRRRDNHLWCLPTGKVEEGESKEEAVRREIEEELGIQVDLRGLRAVCLEDSDLRFTYPNGDSFHFVVFLFQGIFRGGTVRASREEVEEWGFFLESDFPSPFFALHRKWVREMSGQSGEAVL